MSENKPVKVDLRRTENPKEKGFIFNFLNIQLDKWWPSSLQLFSVSVV